MGGGALGLGCAAAGVWLLRAAWRARGGRARVAAGWLVLACGTVGWRLAGAAWDKAVAMAVLAGGLCALGALAMGGEGRGGGAVRRARAARPVEAPPVEAAAFDSSAPRAPAWRGLARAVCAGPLAGLAAVGAGAALALRVPGSEADRLVAASFLTPSAWAAAAVWATMDARIARVAAGLAVAAAAAFGLAAL